MKRYIKYGLIIIAALAVVAIVFYMIKKPKESVVKNISADATYCFTIDKRQFFKETDFLEKTFKDSFIQKLKSKIPPKAIEVYSTVGLNSLGDLAVFGEKNSEVNLAWIGNYEEKLAAIIKRYKWPEKKFKNYNQVKISDNLFINYKWPVVIISTSMYNENFDFFNPLAKKINDKDLRNTKTRDCLIYGYFIADRNTIIHYPFIPLDGKAFIGLKKDDKKIEVFFAQQKIKLKGKLGLPQKTPVSLASLSWPIDSQPVSSITQIPTVIMDNINKLIAKPVKHLYAEVLDTISTYQEIVRYDLDAEFQLTQKIINHYKTYPGLRIEFIKKTPDVAAAARATNMGLEIFKLNFSESNHAYVIASEDNTPRPSAQNLPDYYLYANLDALKTDPFWAPFIKTTFKKLELHAEALGKGSVFVLTLE